MRRPLEVLLVAQALVGRDQRVVPLPFRQVEKLPHCPCQTRLSPRACPPYGRIDVRAAERVFPDRTAASMGLSRRRALASCSSTARTCFASTPGNHVTKSSTRRPARQVFIQCRQWDPRAGKDPRATDLARRAFHRRTRFPARHLCHLPWDGGTAYDRIQRSTSRSCRAVRRSREMYFAIPVTLPSIIAYAIPSGPRAPRTSSRRKPTRSRASVAGCGTRSAATPRTPPPGR